jgi:hypothetical protein
MPYGESLSQIGNATGIAAEVNLGSFRYVENQDDQYNRTSGGNAIANLPARTGEKQQAKPIRVDYTSAYGVSSYGVDSMVSQASVIHELAYGRISTVIPRTGGTGYPIPRDMTQHDLDIIV